MQFTASIFSKYLMTFIFPYKSAAKLKLTPLPVSLMLNEPADMMALSKRLLHARTHRRACTRAITVSWRGNVNQDLVNRSFPTCFNQWQISYYR